MSDSSQRRPSIRRWAVHPLFPMLMVPLVHPYLGWLWMVVNSSAIAGPSRRPEIAAIVVAAVGATTLGLAELLATENLNEVVGAWLRLGTHTWLLGGSLVAFAWQKRRWDLLLPLERQAVLAGEHDPTLANPPLDAIGRAGFARQLLERGWLRDAEHHARAAIRRDPSELAGHQSLVEALLLQGRFDDSAEAASIGLERVEDARLHVLLASALNADQRHSEADTALQTALLAHPEDRTLRLLAAETLAVLGRLDEAEQAARDLAAGDPYDADAQALVADILLRRGKLEEVRTPARNALRHDPDHPVARHAIGAARAQQIAVLGDWWRHNAWLARNGEAWGIAPYLLAFVLFEMAPLLDHPGPRRVGVALAIGYAAFGILGALSYRVQLAAALEEQGL